MLSETGCDGVMVGRGAIGNPWLIRDIVHYLRTGQLLPPPTVQEKVEVALGHLADLARSLGEDRAVRHLRGQLPQYFQSMPGVTRLREQIHSACTFPEVEAALRKAGQTAGSSSHYELSHL